MFGYLVADTATLTEEQFKRYKACYCGLCRSLERRHGQVSRLTLNYDTTFLVLLLGSLYEPEEAAGESKCPRHMRTPQAYACSEISDYAADMNVALAYLNCLDDWEDDTNPGALLEAKLLKGSYEKVREQYPRQIAAIEQEMNNLHEIEQQNLEAPDAAAACFGRLMAELFVYRDDRWATELRATGYALGCFIYLMDACMDLDKDTLHNSYNPFRRYYGLNDNEQRFRDILKMQLGDCVWHFDMLPLVQDVGLMKNILCTGLWAKFNSKFSKRKES
jgi:ferredoxin-thioredoxin reductase catalytic subunit